MPVQIFLSGLAGGVIAGRRFARDHLSGNSITLDMGGTSADVSPTKFVNTWLKRGDLILLLSPGGGGYGTPDTREEQALREDIADGFVSAEGLAAYGREAEDY